MPLERSSSSMMVQLGDLTGLGTSSDTSSISTLDSTEFDPGWNKAFRDHWLQRLFDRTMVVMAQAAQLLYLVWRWYHFCKTPSTLLFSVPLIISETLIVFGGSFITYFMIWNQCRRPKCRLYDMKLDRKDLPTVDIIIPCYNEPVEIVRFTTLAALAVDYPKEKLTVCVCDDGSSPAMRTLVAQMIADMGDSRAMLRYIARKKVPGVPHHAKAGNVNNAIFNETRGDFIVIFDCDMVCRPEIMQAVLPHFYDLRNDVFVIDEMVAMVQTPQSFTNVPEDDPLGQQYRYFYGPVLRGWDAVGSSPCCGTNVVFNRSALTSVGGFTYGSITEDFLTSMTLHSHGYRTKYVHEYMAKGLSPETVHDFMKQRFRWAAGGLEIFVGNNALLKKGLTPAQRFLYFWSGFNTCLAIPMIYLISCPIIFLIGGGRIQISHFETYEYFMYFGPYLFLQVVCMFISYRTVSKMYLIRSLQESVFMLPCYARAVITVVLGVKLRFKVTSKDADTSAFRKSLNWVIPTLIYNVMGCVSLGIGALNIRHAAMGHDVEDITAVCVSVFWITFIMWQSWPPVRFMFNSTASKHKRGNEAAAADDHV